MLKADLETDLRAVILQLENKQAEEGKMLKKQLHLAYESIKPINMIKSTFEAAAQSQDLKNNILNTSVGLSAGYLSKLLFVGVSTSPLKKLLGTALLFGITNIVAKNPGVIKLLATKVLKIIGKKSDNGVEGGKTGQDEVGEIVSGC
jgi:hypothetical protein